MSRTLNMQAANLEANQPAYGEGRQIGAKIELTRLELLSPLRR